MLKIKRAYYDQIEMKSEGRQGYFHVYDDGLQLDHGFRYKRDAVRFREIVEDKGISAALAWELDGSIDLSSFPRESEIQYDQEVIERGERLRAELDAAGL